MGQQSGSHALPASEPVARHEADLPAHGGAFGAMQHLQQACDLGGDVLLTCTACGSNELHYKEDYQFSCSG